MEDLIRVSDIMTKELVTVGLATPLEEVHELLNAHNFHHIPVVEEGMKLKGIISSVDLMKVAYTMAKDATGENNIGNKYPTMLVSEVMTNDPIQLDPDDTIGLAADIFLANKFHSLPIVEDDQLVGIITTHDLLKAAFSGIPIFRT